MGFLIGICTAAMLGLVTRVSDNAKEQTAAAVLLRFFIQTSPLRYVFDAAEDEICPPQPVNFGSLRYGESVNGSGRFIKVQRHGAEGIGSGSLDHKSDRRIYTGNAFAEGFCRSVCDINLKIVAIVEGFVSFRNGAEIKATHIHSPQGAVIGVHIEHLRNRGKCGGTEAAQIQRG